MLRILLLLLFTSSLFSQNIFYTDCDSDVCVQLRFGNGLTLDVVNNVTIEKYYIKFGGHSTKSMNDIRAANYVSLTSPSESKKLYGYNGKRIFSHFGPDKWELVPIEPGKFSLNALFQVTNNYPTGIKEIYFLGSDGTLSISISPGSLIPNIIEQPSEAMQSYINSVPVITPSDNQDLQIETNYNNPRGIIAILELEQKGLTKQEAEILTDRLITKLISIDKYQVVERTNMDKILKEQKFQHSGCTDSECAVEIGQLLNTDYIVIGSVSKFGSTYAVDARLIDVAQGKSLISAEYSMEGKIDKLLTLGITSVARQLSGMDAELIIEAIPNLSETRKDKKNIFQIIKPHLSIKQSQKYKAIGVSYSYGMDYFEEVNINNSNSDSSIVKDTRFPEINVERPRIMLSYLYKKNKYGYEIGFGGGSLRYLGNTSPYVGVKFILRHYKFGFQYYIYEKDNISIFSSINIYNNHIEFFRGDNDWTGISRTILSYNLNLGINLYDWLAIEIGYDMANDNNSVEIGPHYVEASEGDYINNNIFLGYKYTLFDIKTTLHLPFGYKLE